jgi:SAM-dependent methyltransferase
VPAARAAYHSGRRAAARLAALSPSSRTGFDSLPPAEAVRTAYDVLLAREPDPAGIASWQGGLEAGQFTNRDLVQLLCSSPEFESASPFSPRTFGSSLHVGRCRFIRSLPRAAVIIDLGGTNLGDERGAMVSLGYPYDFESLTIVDLPSDERHEIYRSAETDGVVRTERGPVHYRYHSMVDLAGFADSSADLVYMGQSIEHIPPDAGAHVVAEAHRILRPGGHLAVDTPNGRVTRLQQDEFIDPDHEVEYTWPQLEALLTGGGFTISWRQGINYAGHCLERGTFDLDDVARHSGLYAAIEDCYLLAVVARKDA